MGLNWNEIKSRALLFSKTWADACNENSQAKPFWIDFFEIFGITNKRLGTFELNVKKLGGAQGFVDLFWPGVLLVEHKSRGKNLDDALDQAVGYLHNLPERDLPQLVVVCDFARFRVCRLPFGRLGVINRSSQGLFSRQRRNAPVLCLAGHVQAHRQRGSSLPFLGCPAR